MTKESFDALDRLFHPRSVAVVGVSAKRKHPNRIFLDAITHLGFQGPVYAVNPGGEALEEYETYRNLQDVPGPVDHVIVAVPSGAVMSVLEDCAAKEVKSVTVFSSGFSESGSTEGEARETSLRKWIKNQPFRLIGPNCMGIYCPKTGLGFRKDLPSEPGGIGMVSQSGGMTITGVLLGGAKGLRFSKAVSYGNETDLSSSELLRYLAHDPETDLVCAYVEGIDSGSGLIQAMEEVTSNKPLLILKGGASESGKRAAASHTGSMAGASGVRGSFF
ncbi:CoA-binding protein [Thermodesulfobacteriota bacterium]